MIKISESAKLNKRQNFQKNNTWYASQYAENGLIPFTLNIGLKADGIKKDLKPPKGYNEIDSNNYENFVDNNMNGMAIRTGCEICDGYYLILIDIDNKETDKVKHGLTKWNSLISQLTKRNEINTPIQKTGNGGLHYLFKVPENIFVNLPSSGTELEIMGEKYAIDFKGKNQFMIVEPSSYGGKTYKWLENSMTDLSTDIQVMPDWLIKIITNKKVIRLKSSTCIRSNKATKLPKDIDDNNDEEDIDDNNDEEDVTTNILKIEEYIQSEKNISLDDLEQYIYVLDKKRANDYSKWVEIGFCLFNINKDSLYIWKKFSKQSNKYDEKECDSKWKTFRTNKDGLKLGSLIHWMREDNPDKFALTKTNIITKDVLGKFRDKYKNNMEIDHIIKFDDHNRIELKDTYCDIKQEHHETNDMFVEMYPYKFNMKCHHPSCRRKTLCEHIKIPVADVKTVFNQYVQNNYYFNSQTNEEVDEFKKINLFETDHMNDIVYTGLNGKPNPFAEIIYELNKYKYAYAENEEWYIYENHHWVMLKGYNADLRRSFRIELKNIYTKVKDYYIDNEVKNSKTVKSIKSLISNFDSTQLADDIMKELKYIYMTKNKHFYGELNAKYHLIGFTNGVYDLEKYIFRDGVQEDYISMCTGYDYTAKHTKYHNVLLKFLEDIQPNKAERDYLLTYLSTALFGNTTELFTVLIGQGRNGKSKFIQLLEKVFGDYYDTIKSQTLTSQMKDGDSPSPALLSLANKRLVVASEVLDGTKLNTGFIKFITGRDSVKHRMCHQNDMIKFAPNFVTLLVCNDIPECDNMDNAFSKRLRCINFPTEFVDDDINMQFDNCKQDLFLILLEYYKKYEKTHELLTPTEDILKWTNKYKKYTDIYLNFLNECTLKSETHIRSTDLYESFKEWFVNTNPKEKIPSNRCFAANVRKHNINITNVKISGKTVSGYKNIGMREKFRNHVGKNNGDKIKISNKCSGVEMVCPYDNKSYPDHDGFCKPCFANLFPAYPRVKKIRHQSKEIEVVNYVCNNHEGEWYHDKPLYVNFEGGCCTSRRRIDLRQHICGTTICIEVDQDQHKYYSKCDEFARYNDIVCDMTCKYIFIRYNPDKYKLNNKTIYLDLNTRLKRLSFEINKQIDRIKNDENMDLVEIIHLYYDGYI
jgi:P4 family phage/plasmid primase-like protien